MAAHHSFTMPIILDFTPGALCNYGMNLLGKSTHTHLEELALNQCPNVVLLYITQILYCEMKLIRKKITKRCLLINNNIPRRYYDIKEKFLGVSMQNLQRMFGVITNRIYLESTQNQLRIYLPRFQVDKTMQFRVTLFNLFSPYFLHCYLHRIYLESMLH